MATPALDFSDKISTSSIAFPATPQFLYTVPANKFLLLEELSLAVDGNFNNQGRLLLKMRNQVVTMSGGVQSPGGIQVLANFTANYKKDNVLVLLGTGETIEVSFRSADGTTTVAGQIQMSGYLLDSIEAKEVVEAAKGKVIIASAGLIP